MGNTHFSGPLFVAGVQLTDASGNLIAPVEMGDLDQIVDENGNELLEFDSNASAVNHIVIENSATGVNPKIYAGGEANTGITFENSESEEILILDSVASSVNEITIRSAATGNNPIIAATGEADTGITFDNDQAETMFVMDAVATGVNYIQVENAATGARPKFSVQGEADIGIDFENDQSEPIVRMIPVASSVNWLDITNSATGNPVLFANNGEDDIGFEFHAKNGEEMLKLEATAAATTFVSIKSQATGTNPEISAEGEADLGLTFMNDQSEELMILNCNATAVNEFTLSNAATANAPSLAATGGDTNINIDLTPKGTGFVNISDGGLQVVAQSVTPNTDSGVASTIEDGAIHVTVGAVTTDANDWIVLPPIANVPIGHKITVACNAGSNFEVRTPAASNTTINNVDSDGTQEYLATDTDVIEFTKHTATGWIGVSYTNLGAVRTAVVPD